jgi:hypothetical protein
VSSTVYVSPPVVESSSAMLLCVVWVLGVDGGRVGVFVLGLLWWLAVLRLKKERRRKAKGSNGRGTVVEVFSRFYVVPSFYY